jgi:hypothetical protein
MVKEFFLSSSNPLMGITLGRLITLILFGLFTLPNLAVTSDGSMDFVPELVLVKRI